MRKSELLNYKEKYYIMFSKKGFTPDLIEYAKINKVILITLEDIYTN